MFRLDHKTAIVTGGGSGIGKAISKCFASNGAHVFIFDLDERGGKQTADEIATEGGKVEFIRVNISDGEEVKKAVDVVLAKNKSIEILVNNAGIAHVGNLEKTTDDDFNRLINVNVKGVFNCLKQVVPGMRIASSAVWPRVACPRARKQPAKIIRLIWIINFISFVLVNFQRLIFFFDLIRI